MPELAIQTNDRVFVAGQTGTGKTYAAKYLFDACPRGIIYDIGWESFPGERYPIAGNVEKIDFLKSPKWVFQPKDDSPDKFDEFCEWVFYDNTDITVYVEEIGDILEKDASLDNFGTLLRRGRKLGLGCIMTTQRPQGFRTKLPITQSQHILVFRMFEENDVKFVLKCAGLGKQEEEMVRGLEGYEFFYYDVRHGKAEIMPAIQFQNE